MPEAAEEKWALNYDLCVGGGRDCKARMVVPLKRGNKGAGEGERENGVSEGGFLS